MEVIEIKNIKEFEDKVSTEILINSFNVYCRVSTKDQIENTSLDNQKELGVEYVISLSIGLARRETREQHL